MCKIKRVGKIVKLKLNTEQKHKGSEWVYVLNLICFLTDLTREMAEGVFGSWDKIYLTQRQNLPKKNIQIKENVRFLLLIADQKELLQSSSHLSVWFLRLLPADHHCVL